MGKEQEEPRSQRRYDMRLCANSACDYGGQFEPHDFRMKFCCTQCRVNYFNDLRRRKNTYIFSEERILKQLDKKLERLYRQYLREDRCYVPKIIFAHEEIDIHYLLKEELSSNRERVKWLYRYGTKVDPNHSEYIVIIKRNK